MSVEVSEHAVSQCQSESNNLHLKSFKLRFASQREPGRSYVSAVKPLGLPAVVRAKECVSRGDAGVGLREGEDRALRRVEALFRSGPREKYPAPVTTAQEYGWWVVDGVGAATVETRHHIRDSAWLKERLRVLAANDGLQRR